MIQIVKLENILSFRGPTCFMYQIRIKHGEFAWTVYKRYKHFRQLHESLALFRARYKLPLPNRDFNQRRATIMKDLRGMKQHLKEAKTGRLPMRPEPLVSEEDIPERMKQLQEYLQSLLTCKSYRNHSETLKFFEVSNMSFVHKLGVKSKEGLIEKCSGGRRINIQCCGCLQNLHLAGTWNKRWLVVKDSCILYIRPEDGHVRDTLLMDSAFKVRCGIRETGAKHGVLIENYSRKLLIKCWTSRKAKEWAEELVYVAKTLASDYTNPTRFGSFAPARENAYARWFVDGNTYFEAVADALEKAKEEIYITDWWLSPEIYLKRPIVDGDKWRLDVILKRKAEQGVKVFVLLYKEIEAALTIKSVYSKQKLMAHSPENIKVLRHPDHMPGKGVLLWAHHEKLVIIDQMIAFAGGLDLCYGRWDDENHRMTDLGSISLKPPAPHVPSSPTESDMLRRPEYSSHTEISMVTSDENVSVSPSSPSLTHGDSYHQGSSLPKNSPLPNENMTNVQNREMHDHDYANESGSEHKEQGHQADNRETVEEKKERQLQFQRQESLNHSSPVSQQPIEANIVIKNSHEDSIEKTLRSSPEFSQRAQRGLTRQISSPLSSLSSGLEGQGDFPSSSPVMSKSRVGAGGRVLVRQASSMIDTTGFSEDALLEINKSMHPFKDIQGTTNFNNKNCIEEESDIDVDRPEISHNNVSIYLDDTIDKEIICMAEDSSSPGQANFTSPENKGGKEKKAENDAVAAKVSRLWAKRSKEKNPELKMSKTNGDSQTVASDDVNGSSSNIVPNGKRKETKKKKEEKKVTKAKKEEMGDGGDGGEVSAVSSTLAAPMPDTGAGDMDVKLRANSNSSSASKTSEVVFLDKPVLSPIEAGRRHTTPNYQSTHITGQNQQTPASKTSNHRAFSLANTVSAMNALRKMVGHKDSGGAEGDHRSHGSDGDDDGNTARRRWRMIFNVSKFENIVRSPQVPERVDESLFYTSNIKHQGHKNRLAKTLKGGMGKLTKHGRRDSGGLIVDKNGLPVAPGVLQHTDSEEDILERGLVGSTKLWIGKDYVNFIYRDFVNLEQPFEDFIDRTKCPRMPWHDIGCVLYGKSARDLARHFIGRWNFTKQEKCKNNNDFPILVPKSTQKCSIPHAMKDITFEVKAQVLRSSCGWSVGIGEIESSIHEAYVHCIENSREFIYIENQFFITQVGNTSNVNNAIGNALYKRILRAHRSGANFKVYVVMPLLPAFEGEFGTNTGAALQAVTHWNYSSICRGGSSLMEQLAKEVPDPNKYIVFCGLRTWDKLDNKVMTELVYVHSKLMIVDDDTVIIGSANINDRSLLGPRDSEIAVMFEDIHKVDVKVGDKQYQAGKFASSLRWTIFREHLGILNDPDFVDLTDVHLDSFYKEVWIKQAAINTTCYDKVFKCLPTDNVQNFAQLRQYQSTPPLAQTDQEASMTWLRKVKGYLVLTPLQFLREESLTPKVGQKEALLPTYLWT
ncbi:phospholipase d1 [Plakobranchus ocellatus]|uniref:phospholipase D n=1 Tax=Plakobranchus ocellatus TaxID=259542 RepID=A0AAV3XQK0_9GAST|nr:phospholipase d1 [Plakobranchus ocellatus]